MVLLETGVRLGLVDMLDVSKGLGMVKLEPALVTRAVTPGELRSRVSLLESVPILCLSIVTKTGEIFGERAASYEGHGHNVILETANLNVISEKVQTTEWSPANPPWADMEVTE